MYLKYKFVIVGDTAQLQEANKLLQEDFDFAYSPFIPGAQKLFKGSLNFTLIGHSTMRVLLFKYVQEGNSDCTEYNAACDINSGLEYFGIMEMDGKPIWEWNVCSEENQNSGSIGITYSYDYNGDYEHIIYDKKDTSVDELKYALEEIIEQCNIAYPGEETQEEFARRIETTAMVALNAYDQREE
jgi:hypothetical protein